jgi:hypothetical protein
MKLSILLIAQLTLVGISSAQPTHPVRSWQFHSIVNAGLLEGQSGSAFQIQTINGTQYRSWFAGIGLGIDYYRYRTLPLFFDLRKEFGSTGNKIFLYSDFGINFSWVTDKQKMNYVTDDKFGNNFYSDVGFGYKVAFTQNNSLQLSLGYSYKKVVETYTTPDYYIYPPTDGNTEQINNRLYRLLIKIGWVF